MVNDFLEKTLEEIIFEHKDIIHEKGFIKFYEKTFRQFYLPSGRKIDIFSFQIKEDILYFKIVELKRECLTIESMIQISDYFYELMYMSVPIFKEVKYELVLVGRSLDEKLMFIPDLGLGIDLFTYQYKIDGIYFHKVDKGIDYLISKEDWAKTDFWDKLTK